MSTPRQAPLPRTLTARSASAFAGLALAGVGREWPHHFQHLARNVEEVRSPRELHPAFFGCYDWHSAVHGHWALARILRLFPRLPAATRIRAALDENLTRKHLDAELDYFQGPGRSSFERPYGWGWLLALAAELRAGRGPSARRWSKAMRPLETFIAKSFVSYLSKLPYPVRTGLHSNTAFALTLALDYARAADDRPLASMIVERSRIFYGADSEAPLAWEPSGEDFLSPSLTEADLMSRVMPAAEFRRWVGRFLPSLAADEAGTALRPPRAFDRGDPKLAHLDGLNLSRAWALDRIAALMPANKKVREAALRHARAGLAHVVSGNYLGEHWLASFAVYLLTS